MIRAVIDTNVLVSALITPSGNEALIILAIHQRLIKPCCSEDMFEEYVEVLARPKFYFPTDEINALIALLGSNGEHVSPGSASATLPDPADARLLACARAAEADVIVTGNSRHFPQEMCGAIEVVNAAELLDRMTFEA